ncbi:hypothetical protein B0A48_18518 [Cryoendolithus antarcticus]|uniref:Uncharacterized protein n=1 Tax=Cryoendolithus antarcticus TaxID=1507870 RepID=A0A1V8S8P4_9PEZI|nr:hypothetical protein B0A48_18518 [Cryoendolithus antarcticus]
MKLTKRFATALLTAALTPNGEVIVNPRDPLSSSVPTTLSDNDSRQYLVIECLRECGSNAIANGVPRANPTLIEPEKDGDLRHPLWPQRYTKLHAGFATKEMHDARRHWADGNIWLGYMWYIKEEDSEWPEEYDDFYLDMNEDPPQLQIRASEYYELPRPPVLALQECMQRHGFTLMGTGFTMEGWDVPTTAITATAFAARSAAR